MSLGLCIQLLIWSSNREARCEHAAASRAEHICGLCRSASTLPPSSTRPHLLPGLAIRTVRNHVIVAFAICKIIEIEYEGPVMHSVRIHLPRDEIVACALRVSIAVPVSQHSYGVELSDIHGKCRRSYAPPTNLAILLDAPKYV